MLETAEAEAARIGLAGRLRYVIGTEVPAPGGSTTGLMIGAGPTADSARNTLRAHRLAFDRAGLGHAWSQVLALVVQPGVEFDHLHVVNYRAVAPPCPARRA